MQGTDCLMQISKTNTDILILEPKVFKDERGFFLESFNQKDFSEVIGQEFLFVQDNHSRSKKNVLRGLHYQLPKPQGKLVRVVAGEVFDVGVDLRKSSPTFGQWTGINLKADKLQLVWIPPGFAHGFLVLSDTADFFYKTTDYYDAKAEHCLKWDDLKVGIEWPTTVSPEVSLKDQQGQTFDTLRYFP